MLVKLYRVFLVKPCKQRYAPEAFPCEQISFWNLYGHTAFTTLLTAMSQILPHTRAMILGPIIGTYKTMFLQKQRTPTVSCLSNVPRSYYGL